MKKYLAFIFIFIICSGAYAQATQNELLLSNVLKQLKMNRKQIHEPLVRMKKMPSQADQTILVIPKNRINEDDPYGHLYMELDAYVIVAETTTGKIRYRHITPNAWTSDAIMLSDISIDTGLYQLNPQQRAFGIRVSYQGSSQPNPYSKTDLSLFVVQSGSLKKILNNYTVNSYRGEWDTTCSGAFETVTGVIDLDKSKTNGFPNLILKNKIESTKNTPTKDDCTEKKSYSTDTRILRYNGKEYR